MTSAAKAPALAIAFSTPLNSVRSNSRRPAPALWSAEYAVRLCSWVSKTRATDLSCVWINFSSRDFTAAFVLQKRIAAGISFRRARPSRVTSANVSMAASASCCSSPEHTTTRSLSPMANDARRLADPSKSTITKADVVDASSISSSIERSPEDWITEMFFGRSDICDHFAKRAAGSASMSVTVAFPAASSVPRMIEDVVFPAPPFEDAKDITGMEFCSLVVVDEASHMNQAMSNDYICNVMTAQQITCLEMT